MYTPYILFVAIFQIVRKTKKCKKRQPQKYTLKMSLHNEEPIRVSAISHKNYHYIIYKEGVKGEGG